jgi:hypothetical protein
VRWSSTRMDLKSNDLVPVSSELPPPHAESVAEEVDTGNLGFLNGLANAPCFRETALYSISGSATLAALHLHRNRKRH